MNAKVFSNAIGEVDEKYVTEAINYQRSRKRKPWVKWFAAAACICLVLAGIFPLFNNQPGVSPFVLTAYAVQSDNTVSAITMQEGENIPVSFFEANNGLKGFIFSYEAEKALDYLSFAVMTAGQQGTIDQHIEAINGLKLSKDNFYVFFIPPQDQPAPYGLPLTIENEANNTIALLNVVIEENENGYIARIDSISIHEKRTEPQK